MVKISDVVKVNSEEKDSIYIHLENKRKSEFDPMVDVFWEGYLKDMPEEYMDYEVIETGQSLTDNEKGINGYCIEVERKIEKKEENDSKDKTISCYETNDYEPSRKIMKR